MTNFIIKDTPNKGQGLFTLVPFTKQEILFMFVGKSLTLAEAIVLPNNDRFLQIGADNYLDLGTHPCVFANHSCSPNCYVKIALNNAFLVSLRPIKAGEELTYDYALTSTETIDTWSMKCACDIFYCRKIISGFSSMPKEQQEKLIAGGLVPKYVSGK